MSVDAITWAYRQDVKPAARKFILVTLCNWSDPIGYGWWPQSRIAQLTGQEIRAVRNHLSALEEGGLIRRVARRDKKGRRDDDGFMLDPDNLFGLEEIIGARKPELIEAFRSKRHNLPVDTAEPTGTFGKSNRHVSQVLPAESAAIYNEETTLNTTLNTTPPPVSPPLTTPAFSVGATTTITISKRITKMNPSSRSAAAGLQPIGDHLPRPGPSREVSGSTSATSPIRPTGPETTGPRALAKADVSSTGTPRSEIGSVGPPMTEAQARAVQAMDPPADIDENLLAWLPPSVRSSITSITRWRESPGTCEYNEPYTASYELRGDFEEADAREALRLVKLLNAPAAPSDCAMALGKLKAITMPRNVTAEDLTLQIGTMTEEVCAYPLDVVRGACRAWARSDKFFPTWAELRRLCEERALLRRALARELRRHLGAIEKRDPAQEAPTAKAPPAVAVWRDHRAQLEALAAWPVLERAIPDSDDGETLTLAVEAPGLGFAVLAWAARDAQIILGRRITCIVRNWVQPALFERKVQIGGAPSTELHRRDGEIVKLDDSGWRVWRAGVGMLEGLPCEDAVRCCLPDDLDGQGLVLAVPGFKEACAVMDHPDELAKAFGVPVRKVFMSWIDAASKVRPDMKEAAA